MHTELRFPTALRFGLPLAVVVWASHAGAEPSIAVPQDCGSASVFEAELRLRIGPRTDAILRQTELSIDRDGEQYRLRMRVGTDPRELRDPSCTHLFRAAVVVAASHAEARGDGAIEAGAGPAQPSPETGGPRPTEEARAAATAPRPGRAPVFGAAVALGTNFGFLPSPSLGVEIAGSASWEPWGIAVRARYLAPSTRKKDQTHGVTVQAAGGELAATFTAWQILEFSAGMNLRIAFGAGQGSPAPSSDTAWSYGPVARLWAMPLQWSDTWVGVGGDVAFDLAQPRFEILRYGEVFRSSQVNGSIFVGAGHRFR